MGIAIAKFGQAIYFAVRAHGDTVGVNAAKAGIPGLYAVKPDIFGGVYTIHHFSPAAMAEKAMQRVCDNGQPSLLMNEVNAALHTLAGRDVLLDKERQQVTVACAYLLADDEIKAIRSLHPEVARAQGALDNVVIGNGDYIQHSALLHMLENLFDGGAAVAVGTVHM